MVANTPRDWARRLGRLVVSVFLVVHVVMTVVWVMPPCPIRVRSQGVIDAYMLPLGLWQYWGMFAPDPVRNALTLEAEVVDSRGLRYAFAFPRLADYSKWGGVPRFRHSKFAMNLAIRELRVQRETAARHVLRQLAVSPDAFPVDVHLVYQVRPSPPPGGAPADPMTPPHAELLDTVHFATAGEVTP